MPVFGWFDNRGQGSHVRQFIFILGVVFCCLISNEVSAKPLPAKAFGALPDVYDAAISPDAKQVAMFLNMNGNYGVAIFNIDGEGHQNPRVIGLEKGVKPEWIKWVNNDRILISIWQSNIIDTTPITAGYIHTVDVNTGKGKTLIKPRNIFRQYNNNVVDFLEDDPNYILMSFADKNVNAPDIKKVNVKTGKYTKVKRGTVKVQAWYTDLRGEPRIGQGRIENKKGEWYLTIRDADSKTWRHSDEYPGIDADVDIYGFTKNPNELVLGLYGGRDTKGLYIYDLVAKKIVKQLFHNGDYDVGGLIYSADGKSIVGAKYVADSEEIELFEQYKTVLGHMREKFEGYTVDYVDQSLDGKVVLFKVSSADSPGALMMVDTKSDEITRLSTLHRDLPSNEMGKVTSVKYKTRDGELIPAYVTLPRSVSESGEIKNIPFIILPHGGPYARSSKRFDYFSQFFASRGFAVLQMNFRGSAGYGKKFKDAGRENWVQMQEDVEDGARWLLRKGYADPDRMCIVGWSYGGYAALMGAIKNPELYACAVSMAGVTDLRDMVRDIEKYRFGKIAAKDFVLKGFENKDAIKENSPVKRARELTVPLFLAHGKLDQRVHYDQFMRMKRALKKSPATVTYMTFKGEDHYLSDQENRQQFFVGLDQFLKETVGVLETAP